MRFTILVLCAILVTRASAAETQIIVSPITVYPDSRESRVFIQEALTLASSLISRDYPEISLVPDTHESPANPSLPGTPVYRLTVQAITSPDGDTVSLTLSGDFGEVSAIPIMRDWDDDLYRAIAQQVFFLSSAAHGFSVMEEEQTPVFVAEMDLNELVGSTLNVPGVQLYPQSLAVLPGGEFVVGCITVAVRFGPDFSIRALPGMDLLEQGNYTSAMSVAATPAGTLVTRPSMGRDLYLYQPGIDRAQRVRSSLAGSGPLAVLPDGSIVVTDTANRAAQIIRDRHALPLDLFAQEYSFLPAIAAGPEGNVWAFDTMERRVMIYRPDGILLDSILPLAPVDIVVGTRAMAVAPDGTFLLLTGGGLWKFDRRGRALWRLDELPGPDPQPLGQMSAVAYDYEHGVVLLADYLAQRVIRLAEPATDRLSAFDREILDMNTELARGRNPIPVLTRLAEYYESRQSFEMAQSVWRRVLDEDAFDRHALSRIDALDEMMLLQEAERVARIALDTLHAYGPETARRDFSRAMQRYEEVLYLNPRSERGREGKRLLEEAFSAEPDQDSGEPQLYTVSLELEEIFPSLLEHYRNGGAGTITLRNITETTIDRIEILYLLPAFMTGPVSVEVGRLAPGASVTASLPAVFEREILSLEEDLPAQVEIRVRYPHAGENREFTEYATTTVHRRTALIWDRSEKLAAFITPNEDVVAAFAFHVLAQEWDAGDVQLPDTIRRALHLVEGLGRYRINYTEDPSSPISAVLGSPMAVDTVRFPRTTLYYRAGDCDDTSALLASLFEAAGIETAILTTPGHVFIAWNTDEPAENRWMFESESTAVLTRGGTVWIPTETTALHRGFLESWREASRLVGRYAGSDDLEFIPVRSVRDDFPALPLPPATMTITEPAAEYLLPRVSSSWNEMVDLLYTTARTVLETNLERRAGSRRVPDLNRLGILHARFGEAVKAQEVFVGILDLRSDYLPAYVNLANLAEQRGDREQALVWLDQAELLRPESPSVVEQLARTHFSDGNLVESRRYFERLTAIAPERAARISVIGGGVAGVATVTTETVAGRASAGADPASLLPPPGWPVED